MYVPNPLLSASVGGTPLVRLEKVVPDECGTVWLKLESVNPTGSYKDRMAVAVLGPAEIGGVIGGYHPPTFCRL